LTSEQIVFFEKMYREHFERMYKVALKIIKNPDMAFDIVSETFLVLIIQINSVMEHREPVKWLYSVLKNNALGEYRKQKKRAELPLDEAMFKTVAPDFISIKDMLPKGLTPDEQKILSLRLNDNLDYSDIAKLMNITESTCRMKFSRAKKHCAELLAKQEN